MAERLLKALNYPQSDQVNLNDETTFRQLIVWLETNKINRGKPNTVNKLKNINASDWRNYFETYKQELGCPLLENSIQEARWFLGYGVQMETQKNKDIYLKHAIQNLQVSSTPNVITENPLDKINFRSKEFTDGINQVAKILKISPHSNPLITLEAVQKVITKRLSAEALEKPDSVVVKGAPFPIEACNFGFDLKDPILNQAAKILGLLYIQDLRNLQTKANELIVAVQNITANPKTDTKLGKVGK